MPEAHKMPSAVETRWLGRQPLPHWAFVGSAPNGGSGSIHCPLLSGYQVGLRRGAAVETDHPRSAASIEM